MSKRLVLIRFSYFHYQTLFPSQTLAFFDQTKTQSDNTFYVLSSTNQIKSKHKLIIRLSISVLNKYLIKVNAPYSELSTLAFII
jgi:hypothetical protein